MKNPRKGIFSLDCCTQDRLIPDYAQLGILVKSLRENFGYTISLVSGSYDMLHIGHCGMFHPLSMVNYCLQSIWCCERGCVPFHQIRTL